MDMEAETGIILPRSKHYLGIPEVGKDKEGSSPKGFEATWLCQHLDFRL